VFNRGATPVELPRGVRRLQGDRTDHERLKEVLRHEDFDVVQDINGYSVSDVTPMIELFRGRIGHYIFASSTVIYAASQVLPMHESAAVDRGPLQSEYGMNKLLVEDLLFLARAEHGRPILNDPVDLAQIATDAVHDARAVDPSREIDLETPGACAAFGDEAKLRQAAANLLSNAITHTPASGPLTLVTTPPRSSGRGGLAS
jgi:signal transduction histidine kinase